MYIQKLLGRILDKIQESPGFYVPLIFFFVYTPFLGIPSIYGSTEAREAQVVSVILRDNNWILPLRNGIIPSKPILFHWIASCIAFILQDVSPFTPRIVSLISATLLLLATVTFAFKYSSIKSSSASFYDNKSYFVNSNYRLSVSWVTGFILGSSYIFSILAINARVDMLFSLLVNLSIISLIIPAIEQFPLQNPKNENIKKGFFFFYLFASFAVLTKGPLGLILPLILTFIVYTYLYTLKKTLKIFLKPNIGWFLFLFIIFSWYIPAFIEGGYPFLERQILFENIKRITGDVHMNTKGLFFYAPSFLKSLLPWSIVFLYFLYTEIKWFKIKSSLLEKPILNKISLIIVASGLLFFSFASGKRLSYILPLIPWFALYTGNNIVYFYNNFSLRTKISFNKLSKVICYIFVCLNILFLLILEALRGPVQISSKEFSEAVYWINQFALGIEIFLLIPLVLVFCINIKTIFGEYLYIGISYLFISGAVIFIALGIKGHMKAFDEMSIQIYADSNGLSRLTVLKDKYDEYFDPLFYYFNDEVKVLTFNKLDAYKLCPGRILIQYKDLEKLKNNSNAYTVFKPVSSYKERLQKRPDHMILLLECTFKKNKFEDKKIKKNNPGIFNTEYLSSKLPD